MQLTKGLHSTFTAAPAELLARLDRDDVVGLERGELLGGQPVLGGYCSLSSLVPSNAD